VYRLEAMKRILFSALAALVFASRASTAGETIAYQAKPNTCVKIESRDFCLVRGD
jgi:hypothetical protein